MQGIRKGRVRGNGKHTPTIYGRAKATDLVVVSYSGFQSHLIKGKTCIGRKFSVYGTLILIM